MKTCKKCKQIVNVETVTCPYCDGHEFSLNPVKICSLCGKVNAKKSLHCELCGKSFSGPANEAAIATVMNLTHSGQDAEMTVKDPTIKDALGTPYERYIELKAQIETGENEDRCAYFIPGKSNERPIVLLPSFQESNKVDVYLVLPSKDLADKGVTDMEMERIAISKEEDINALSKKRAPRQGKKMSIAALLLFWLNLGIICAFGLALTNGVMGFQIVAAIFNNNPAGLAVINSIKAGSSIGDFAYFVYPVLLGLSVVGLILSLVFLTTKFTKAKKIILIILQSVIFALIIGVYLVNVLIVNEDFINALTDNIGIIVLAACGLLGVIASIFYQYPKEPKKQKPQKEKKEDKVIKEKKEKKQKEPAPKKAKKQKSDSQPIVIDLNDDNGL